MPICQISGEIFRLLFLSANSDYILWPPNQNSLLPLKDCIIIATRPYAFILLGDYDMVAIGSNLVK
jgi:hypothetical protein